MCASTAAVLGKPTVPTLWAVALLAALAPAACQTLCSRQPPTRALSVRLDQFGASTASANNLQAFDRAVGHLAERGGGELVLPAGRWMSAPFNLTSHMTLRLEAGAMLVGTPDISLHPVLPGLPTYGRGRDYSCCHYSSLVHGEHLQDVALIGAGPESVIDGNGAVWWNRTDKNGHSRSLEFTRGHLVELINSSRIHISSLRMQNSPFWTVHPYYSDQVYVCELEIWNPPHSANTDGVDPDSSSNVLIEHSSFWTGDDCIAIKSGWDCFGYRPGLGRPSSNITILDLSCSSPTSAGICIGSEMSGGVHNVTVKRFRGTNVSTGLRVKTARSRGGSVRQISMQDVTLDGVGTAVEVNAFYGGLNPSCGLLPHQGYHTPVVDGILLRNWSGVNALSTADLEGLPDKHSTNLEFVDFSIAGSVANPSPGWKCSAVSGTAHRVQPPPCSQLVPN